MTLPTALLVSLGIIVLAAAILFAMGRLPICNCGYVELWHAAQEGPEASQHLFDPYTFTHVLHGPVFYLLIWLIDRGRLSVGTRLVVAVFLEASWEVVENTRFIINRYQGGNSPDYTGDSIVNSVGDLLAMTAGVLVTSWLPVWVTAILFVAAEVALYLLIQDSLVLNFTRLVLGR
jgi:hypothetical protein